MRASSCREVGDCIIEWDDHGPDDISRRRIEAHIRSCEACRRDWNRQRALVRSLRNLLVPEMSPSLVERILADLWAARRRRHRRAISATGIAVSASLAIGLTLNPMRALPPVAPATRQIQVPEGAPATVRLALDAGHDVGAVQFVLVVPDGFEIQGHPGEHRIAWRAPIYAGRSVLALHILAQRRADGTLSAVLRRGETEKSFTFHIATIDSSKHSTSRGLVGTPVAT